MWTKKSLIFICAGTPGRDEAHRWFRAVQSRLAVMRSRLPSSPVEVGSRAIAARGDSVSPKAMEWLLIGDPITTGGGFDIQPKNISTTAVSNFSICALKSGNAHML